MQDCRETGSSVADSADAQRESAANEAAWIECSGITRANRARKLHDARSCTREICHGNRTVAAGAVDRPGHAKLGSLVSNHFHDYRFHQYLGAPNVQLVDDSH